MSKQEKRRKELARRAKRRKSRPQSAWLSTGPKSPTKLMKQVSRQHADVLQNIETTLLSAYRDCLRVVRDSVKLHSSLSPGDTSYLSFISCYVV